MVVKRVLIADDSEPIRELIQPDLIVLDVLMPLLNGVEVASVLKKNLPSCKIILFTMYGEYVRSLAFAAGVDIVLPKPDGLSPLAEAVDRMLQELGSEPISP